MAIYLDTNVVRQLSGGSGIVNRIALTVLARQLGQDIVIPGLVAEEAAAARLRELQKVLDLHQKALEAVNTKFAADGYVEWSSYPDPGEQVAEWQDRLAEWTVSTPTTNAQMAEGLRREITRRVPATAKGTSSTGGRDAAIWATVRDHHSALAEAGHFVTSDSGFAQGKRLHPDLKDELRGRREIELHVGVDAILKRLGSVTSKAPMTTGELARLGKSAVIEGLQFSPAITRATLDPDSRRWKIKTRVVEAAPIEVEATKHYVAEDSEIQVVAALWDLRAELSAYDANWEGAGLGDARLRIHAQISIAEGESHLIEAEVVESDIGSVHITDNGDGTLGLIRWASNPSWSLGRTLEENIESGEDDDAGGGFTSTVD